MYSPDDKEYGVELISRGFMENNNEQGTDENIPINVGHNSWIYPGDGATIFLKYQPKAKK